MAPGESAVRAARPRRADAERSIEAILDAALDCVLADAEVNMVAIARAAGVSRVTLYAHFPSRVALLEAALQRAVDQSAEVLAGTPVEQGPAGPALARLLRRSWPILHRYRNLYVAASTALPPARLRAHHEPVFGRVERLVARGQAAGDFRADLSRQWLVATVFSLLRQGAEELVAGRLTEAQAADAIVGTVLAALAPPAAGTPA